MSRSKSCPDAAEHNRAGTGRHAIAGWLLALPVVLVILLAPSPSDAQRSLSPGYAAGDAGRYARVAIGVDARESAREIRRFPPHRWGTTIRQSHPKLTRDGPGNLVARLATRLGCAHARCNG